MSERKVLNKYYPPDFDPSKIPKCRLPKNRQWNIRIMAPFNMRCDTCGEYIYKGKKFNSRKEDVENEDYLGLKIFRFYIKCPRCVAEISFRTDPVNTDYALEAGAIRNFEALRTAELMAEQELKAKEEEEKNNPMKVLENRTKASRQEMDMLETLEELRELNSRHAKMDHESVIKLHMAYEEQLKKLQDEEDEALVSSIFSKDGDLVVKRIRDEEDDDGPSQPKLLKRDKPSDILTQDEDVASSSKQKISLKESSKPAAWQKSIGGLGKGKSALQGLVRKKAADPNGSKVSGEVTKQTDSESAKNASGNVVKVAGQTDKVKVEGPKEADVKNTAATKRGGLSLLGAYSDSETDSDQS